MRVSPEDRRNLAQLGLTILVAGLVVAPLSHILVDHAGFRIDPAARAWLTHGAKDDAEHAHPHSHSHGGKDTQGNGRGHTHAPGSVQHLTALFAPSTAPAPVARVEAVTLAALVPPALPLRAVDSVHPAMPQGP